MRSLRKVQVTALSMSTAFALAILLSGCDAPGSQATETKPIQSDILKKLGAASKEQGQTAQGKLPARVKKKAK